MREKLNLKGKKFNNLTVIKLSKIKTGFTYWECLCDCGNLSIVRGASLKNNSIKSCGCLRNITTHNLSNTEEYYIWKSMLRRCYNKFAPNYKNYGGRGIIVCSRWLKFENFLEDTGMKPSKLHSVDRIDNDKGYSKDNCKWSTKKEQANNRRNSVKIINLETNEIFSNIQEAANSINMNLTTFWRRLNSSKLKNFSKFKEVV